MKLRDLIQKLVISNERLVITALAYEKGSKKYYSFRTAMDILPNCFDTKTALEILSDEELDCDVKSVSIYSGKGVWIDIIEWVDD